MLPALLSPSFAGPIIDRLLAAAARRSATVGLLLGVARTLVDLDNDEGWVLFVRLAEGTGFTFVDFERLAFPSADFATGV